MNNPVSFFLAKLLKEKEFNNIECKGYYHVCDGYTKGYAFCYSDIYSQEETAILAPTIADVVMWIYEKHAIWIYSRPVLDDDGEWIFKGYVKLMNDFKAKEYQTKLLRKPTEVYEAAIEYTLNNLL